MVTALLSLLSSSAFGTIFGGLMGLWNRRVDIQYEKLKMAEREKERAHDLAVMDKEWAGRFKVAETEGEAKVEVAQFASQLASYKAFEPEKGSWVADFSSFVRPCISLGYFIGSTIGFAWIIYYALCVYNLKLTDEELYKIVFHIIEWFSFMASSTIGWWFAMRSGKPPQMKMG